MQTIRGYINIVEAFGQKDQQGLIGQRARKDHWVRKTLDCTDIRAEVINGIIYVNDASNIERVKQALAANPSLDARMSIQVKHPVSR